MGFLNGKRALIVGVASNRSIAWGIAEAFAAQGAELAFTYQNEKLKSRVDEIAKKTGSSINLELDVADDDSINQCFTALKSHWDEFDILIHSVGFAPREALAGRFVEATSREAWNIAQDISAYSLTALTRAAYPFMKERQGSVLTLSYLGAVRSVQNYNLMGPAKAALESSVRFLAADLGGEGIRVNAISAGPIKTLAASGVSGFRSMLNGYAEMAPLKRNITAEEVGNAAAFLCSDLASGITGQIVYVDAGFNTVGFAG